MTPRMKAALIEAGRFNCGLVKVGQKWTRAASDGEAVFASGLFDYQTINALIERGLLKVCGRDTDNPHAFLTPSGRDLVQEILSEGGDR